MPRKLKISEVAKEQGMTVEELLTTYGEDSVMPACCEEGCMVEPDGKCEHGHPSILLALGMI
jgi:hypothetical protein